MGYRYEGSAAIPSDRLWKKQMGMGEMHRHRLIATPRITNRIDRQIQLTPFLRLVKASKEHFACCFACSNWDAPAKAENPAQIKSIKPIQTIIIISPNGILPFHAQSAQALGKGRNIHVEHDACHIFVECTLYVDGRIVNKDAFLRAKGELAQEGAVDLRVGL